MGLACDQRVTGPTGRPAGRQRTGWPAQRVEALRAEQVRFERALSAKHRPIKRTGWRLPVWNRCKSSWRNVRAAVSFATFVSDLQARDDRPSL